MPASLNDIDLFFQSYDRDFNGACEATMFQVIDRFGTPANPRSFDTAYLASQASTIYTADPAKASYGDFGFWDKRLVAAGHTALWTPRGWLMGSARVTTKIGGKSRNVGYISFADYTKTGFLGFAKTSGGRDIDLYAYTPMPASAAKDWSYVEPTSLAMRKRIQKGLAARGRYNLPSGAARPIDGDWAERTRMGVQLTIQGVGYRGLVDGKIEREGCFFVQTYAEKFGDYDGPIDRKLGDQTWLGFALGLERP